MSEKLSSTEFCYSLARRLATDAIKVYCANPFRELFIVGRRDGVIYRDLRVANGPGEGEELLHVQQVPNYMTLGSLVEWIYRDYLRSASILPPELFP